jgi:hypothetical protein
VLFIHFDAVSESPIGKCRVTHIGSKSITDYQALWLAGYLTDKLGNLARPRHTGAFGKYPEDIEGTLRQLARVIE